MQKIITGTILCVFISFTGCTQANRENAKSIGGPCEDCRLMFEGMPAEVSWETTLTSSSDRGEPLTISGIIYKKDGKTPASGVILYVYQTDHEGLYSRGPNQKYAVRHGHLRGWVKTNAKGEYKFNTIRPASYPNSNNPQHIHPIIYEPGKGYYWIDEYLFTDDPVLTEAGKSNVRNRGGSGIITPVKDERGVWIGKRDIVLGLHVTDY